MSVCEYKYQLVCLISTSKIYYGLPELRVDLSSTKCHAEILPFFMRLFSIKTLGSHFAESKNNLSLRIFKQNKLKTRGV